MITGRLLRALAIFVLALLAGPVLAQEAAPSPSVETVEAQTGDEPSEAVASAARVTDPDVTQGELAHLLIPLTKPELAEVTDSWLANVRAATQEIADLQAEIKRNPAKPGDPRFSRLARMVEHRAGLLSRYSMAVDSFERKGGDPARVADLRAYREAVLFEETAQAGTGALAGALLTWAGRSDGGVALLKRIGIALLALVAIVLVARFVRGFAHVWLGRFSQLSRLLQNFIAMLFFWLFIVIGLLLVLASIDVDVTPIFALIGGASFILAFAFQDTLGNLASGLMILVNQPFDEGDYIDVGGVSGTVQNVSIVATTIATADNKIIVVPNRNVWGNVIVNASASDIRRVDLVFGASYDDPIQQVLDTINQVVAAHPKILAEPATQVAANELGDSAVSYVCRPWVKAGDYLEVYWDLTRQVKEAFDAQGLTMPYPTQEVRIKGALPAR
ncbi:mechanosensitive ion channel family protein [Erythrobacter sp. sf7]|uniref:Small-conductance mechanosensitive channel n=1 Tax=Erythrobacter fulvus TaxID=2987523 RepID=A0ABT5JUE5_9SPHN|nr:mechanosensitive ion channel family protein [Erythrobacter fulvus]MDC8755172.1 mechanosensitive ion channel family protein [Erythrobacter fulvus]